MSANDTEEVPPSESTATTEDTATTATTATAEITATEPQENDSRNDNDGPIPESWQSAIDEDSKLSGVTTLGQLHERMQVLSAEVTANSDAKTNAVFEQLHFKGICAAPVFQPHFARKDVGTMAIGAKISDYYRYAVKSVQHVKAALEFINDECASVVLPADTNTGKGALLLSGYMAVRNKAMFEEHNIRLVINTARNLGKIFPKYAGGRRKRKKEGVTFKNFKWGDSKDFQIPEADVRELIQLTESARSRGEGVLIHCAQGKSRSVTGVIAYVAATAPTGSPLHNNVQAAKKFVKKRRSMVSPNSGFLSQLRDWEKRKVLITEM